MIQNTLIINNGIDTSDATATVSDVLNGKTFYANGIKITGNIPTKTESNLTSSGATVTVPVGYYPSQVSKSVATATQATPSISVNSAGKITASATQSAGYVSAGTKSATKQLTTQAAQTITPGTSNKTIASNRYLTGTQTIKGDSNLVASNIKSGVSIFGVAGTLNAGFVTQVRGSGTSYIRIPGLTSIPNYIVVFAHTMIDVLDVMQACYFSKSATIGTQGFNFLQLYCNRSGNSTYNMRASTIGLVSSSELEDGTGYYYDSSAFYLCVTSGRIFNSATTYTCLAG